MSQKKFKILDHPLSYADTTELPVSRELHTSITQADKTDWRAFFQNFRLSFRSRILSHQGDDLIKLQGKLEGVDEIEAVFMDMFR